MNRNDILHLFFFIQNFILAFFFLLSLPFDPTISGFAVALDVIKKKKLFFDWLKKKN